MRKLIAIAMLMIGAAAGHGQVACPAEGCNVEVAVSKGVSVSQTNAGEIWLTLRAEGAPTLRIRVGAGGKYNTEQTGSFFADFIINRPPSDIVAGEYAVADRFQINGDCSSRNYQIYGVVPISAQGFMMAEYAVGPEQALRHAEKDTLTEKVFMAVCK